ncbi:hypothetical protein O4H52_10155 [Sphingomonadaceae bacterium G21617-S1]|uniref:hypothetical protein n=1 Tax=Rhizorhabdus sp. TaxID=1968843 RepID=UPI0022BB1FC9|nr:hypothetical protein [Rhizorhabdus sp.]MCZ4341969.1 hypothetical protein [Sphingomonadaceae bacterium G21617-S1]
MNDITPTSLTPDKSAAPVSNAKTALTDDLKAHFSGDAPLAEKAKSFAKARPWTSAAFLGVAAIGLLQTLRGARR